jgi:hypothetical protein
MCPPIDNPASCKIHAIIHFLHVKNTNAVEIHCELRVVYGQNVMCEKIVRQWCKMFKNEEISVHGEERSGQPYL